MIPEVVNLRTCKDFGTRPGDVRIDRSTKWGNPFFIGVLNRNEACDAHERWFKEQEKKGALDINELKDAKRLGCWCKPLRCHGDYLAKRIGAL